MWKEIVGKEENMCGGNFNTEMNTIGQKEKYGIGYEKFIWRVTWKLDIAEERVENKIGKGKRIMKQSLEENN